MKLINYSKKSFYISKCFINFTLIMKRPGNISIGLSFGGFKVLCCSQKIWTNEVKFAAHILQGTAAIHGHFGYRPAWLAEDLVKL